MTDTDSIKDDIAYVRAVAERTGPGHVPAIYVLWAVICLCGFPLVDLVGPGSGLIGIYWLTAGPVGGLVTWWLAARAGVRDGQADRRTGQRWAGHFLGFFGVGLLGCLLAATGELSWSGLSSLWILILALTYFLAGLASGPPPDAGEPDSCRRVPVDALPAGIPFHHRWCARGGGTGCAGNTRNA